MINNTPLSLYVTNLPLTVTEAHLCDHFKRAGTVSSVSLGPSAGGSSQSAIVTFQSPQDAGRASTLDLSELHGQPICVRLRSYPLPDGLVPQKERKQRRGRTYEIVPTAPQDEHASPLRPPRAQSAPWAVPQPFPQQVPQTPRTSPWPAPRPNVLPTAQPSLQPIAQPSPQQVPRYPLPTAQPSPQQVPQPSPRQAPRPSPQQVPRYLLPTAQPSRQQVPRYLLLTAHPSPQQVPRYLLPTAQPSPQVPRYALPTAQPSPPRQAPRPFPRPAPQPTQPHSESCDSKSNEKRIKTVEEIVCHPPTEFTYLNSHSSDLDCMICAWPLLSPQVHTCEHTFCLNCTSKLSRCPICRGPMNNSSLKECKLRIILNLLNDLMVKCSKCSKEMKREQIVHHYNEECPIKCSTCGCDSTRKTYKEHFNQCSQQKALLKTESERIEVTFSIPMIQTEHGEVPLTLDTIQDYPEKQQRTILGERFYYILLKTHPTLAGKITGMFLESWKTEELLSWLWDEHKLNEMAAEAISALEKVRNRPTIQPQDDGPLTMSALARYSDEQQRLLLGERLHPIIQKTHPMLAGKITGMILYSPGWKIEMILSLLYDEQQLNKKVDEAVEALQTVVGEDHLQ